MNPFPERVNLWLLNEGLNLLKLIALTLILIRVLRWATDHVPRWAADTADPQRLNQVKTLAGVLNGVGRLIIFGFAAATALRELNLDVRPALAGAGIIGLALGLGAQNLVRDAISGIFILMDNQFGVGDSIRVNSITGSVEFMSLRRTVLRDADGALYTIPNGEIRMVANLTRQWSQTTFTVPVEPSQPVDRVLEVLGATALELAKLPQFKDVLIDAPHILGVDKLSGHHLEIMVQARTLPGRQFDVSREWRRLIKQAFERERIAFASPWFTNSSSLPPTA